MPKNTSHSQTIECPNCQTEIEISEVLSSQLEKNLRKTLRKESEAQLKAAVNKAEVAARQQSKLDMQDLQNQLVEHQQQTLTLRKKARELEAQQESVEEEIAKRLKAQEQQLKTTLEAQISEKTARENQAVLQDLQSQVEEKNKAIEQSREEELKLRKQARELEAKQKEFELKLQRELDAGRKQIEAEVAAQIHAESDLKLKEKDKQNEELRKLLKEAKRKSEQGSQKMQGDVLELDLEQKLRQQYPQDDVSAVGKGVRGADIIQVVNNSQLQACGKILWEAKNTKSWSQAWVQKLKDDQMASGANVSVLVSAVLPDSVESFAQIEGVWVCSVASALPLVAALREQLIQLNYARLSAKGKDEKMEMMFQYLTGDEFRQRIETIVSAFDTMQQQIIKERRAMEKQWREREKQIERIMLNTTGMHADVRGIFGSSVQTVAALELDSDEGNQHDLLADASKESKD